MKRVSITLSEVARVLAEQDQGLLAAYEKLDGDLSLGVRIASLRQFVDVCASTPAPCIPAFHTCAGLRG